MTINLTKTKEMVVKGKVERPLPTVTFDIKQEEYLKLLRCVQTGATTPNIVAPIMLGVVACVLAVVCKRTHQLPTLLAQQCWEFLRACWQLSAMLRPFARGFRLSGITE